jgi:two-component system, LytTR family, sensor kinase
MVAGLQLVYELASLRPILTSNRAAGVPLAVSHAIVLGALDGALWMLLVPVVFAAFDRTPLRRGRIGRNLLARTVVSGAAMALQAAAFCGILIAGGGFSDLGVFARTSPLLNFGYEFETNVTTMLMLALAYAVLLRVHAVRHEHRVASALQLSLAEARLHALTIELQPHFLFNTLNGIAALVRDEPETAEAMLIRLSDLLRLTLGVGHPAEISLGDELERMAMYLDIQQMRFGPRLTITVDVDPDVVAAAVPPLVLQPLVENALTHGLAPRRGPGRLDISCQRRADWLVLSVRDDGAGLPPPEQMREGTGIGNTRARLAAMFGDYYRLELNPQPAGGTLVRATVPYRHVGGDALPPLIRHSPSPGMRTAADAAEPAA